MPTSSTTHGFSKSRSITTHITTFNTSGHFDSMYVMNNQHLVNDMNLLYRTVAIDSKDMISIMDIINSRGIFAIQVLHVL